jgi:glycosyltransferase involved in cell wall biosynthesis
MSPTKISYVTTGNPNIASFRYRIVAPASFYEEQGYQAVIGSSAEEEAPIVVFSKHWTWNDWSYAKFCSLRGQGVIYDIFEDKLADHYRRMVSVADVLTCNSERMRQRIQEVYKRDAIVIPDPVLSVQKMYNREARPGLLWYGQGKNIEGLYEVYTKDCSFPLTVVVPGRLEPPEYMNAPQITWTQWHPHVIEEQAPLNSIALLPYRQDKNAKSANRVLEALWNGLPVLTDPLPAVEEINSGAVFYIENTQQQAEGISQMDLSDEMSETQRIIKEKYSPEVVSRMWTTVFDGLV